MYPLISMFKIAVYVIVSSGIVAIKSSISAVILKPVMSESNYSGFSNVSSTSSANSLIAVILITASSPKASRKSPIASQAIFSVKFAIGVASIRAVRFVRI